MKLPIQWNDKSILKKQSFRSKQDSKQQRLLVFVIDDQENTAKVKAKSLLLYEEFLKCKYTIAISMMTKTIKTWIEHNSKIPFQD